MDVHNGLISFLWGERFVCPAGDSKVPLSCTASELPVPEFRLTEAKLYQSSLPTLISSPTAYRLYGRRQFKMTDALWLVCPKCLWSVLWVLDRTTFNGKKNAKWLHILVLDFNNWRFLFGIKMTFLGFNYKKEVHSSLLGDTHPFFILSAKAEHPLSVPTSFLAFLTLLKHLRSERSILHVYLRTFGKE